jgi:hypothetical protein
VPEENAYSCAVSDVAIFSLACSIQHKLVVSSHRFEWVGLIVQGTGEELLENDIRVVLLSRQGALEGHLFVYGKKPFMGCIPGLITFIQIWRLVSLRVCSASSLINLNSRNALL